MASTDFSLTDARWRHDRRNGWTTRWVVDGQGVKWYRFGAGNSALRHLPKPHEAALQRAGAGHLARDLYYQDGVRQHKAGALVAAARALNAAAHFGFFGCEPGHRYGIHEGQLLWSAGEREAPSPPSGWTAVSEDAHGKLACCDWDCSAGATFVSPDGKGYCDAHKRW